MDALGDVPLVVIRHSLRAMPDVFPFVRQIQPVWCWFA